MTATTAPRPITHRIPMLDTPLCLDREVGSTSYHLRSVLDGFGMAMAATSNSPEERRAAVFVLQQLDAGTGPEQRPAVEMPAAWWRRVARQSLRAAEGQVPDPLVLLGLASELADAAGLVWQDPRDLDDLD